MFNKESFIHRRWKSILAVLGTGVLSAVLTLFYFNSSPQLNWAAIVNSSQAVVIRVVDDMYNHHDYAMHTQLDNIPFQHQAKFTQTRQQVLAEFQTLATEFDTGKMSVLRQYVLKEWFKGQNITIRLSDGIGGTIDTIPAFCRGEPCKLVYKTPDRPNETALDLFWHEQGHFLQEIQGRAYHLINDRTKVEGSWYRYGSREIEATLLETDGNLQKAFELTERRYPNTFIDIRKMHSGFDQWTLYQKYFAFVHATLSFDSWKDASAYKIGLVVSDVDLNGEVLGKKIIDDLILNTELRGTGVWTSEVIRFMSNVNRVFFTKWVNEFLGSSPSLVDFPRIFDLKTAIKYPDLFARFVEGLRGESAPHLSDILFEMQTEFARGFGDAERRALQNLSPTELASLKNSLINLMAKGDPGISLVTKVINDLGLAPIADLVSVELKTQANVISRLLNSGPNMWVTTGQNPVGDTYIQRGLSGATHITDSTSNGIAELLNLFENGDHSEDRSVIHFTDINESRNQLPLNAAFGRPAVVRGKVDDGRLQSRAIGENLGVKGLKIADVSEIGLFFTFIANDQIQWAKNYAALVDYALHSKKMQFKFATGSRGEQFYKALIGILASADESGLNFYGENSIVNAEEIRQKIFNLNREYFTDTFGWQVAPAPSPDPYFHSVTVRNADGSMIEYSNLPTEQRTRPNLEAIMRDAPADAVIVVKDMQPPSDVVQAIESSRHNEGIRVLREAGVNAIDSGFVNAVVLENLNQNFYTESELVRRQQFFVEGRQLIDVSLDINIVDGEPKLVVAAYQKVPAIPEHPGLGILMKNSWKQLSGAVGFANVALSAYSPALEMWKKAIIEKKPLTLYDYATEVGQPIARDAGVGLGIAGMIYLISLKSAVVAAGLGVGVAVGGVALVPAILEDVSIPTYELFKAYDEEEAGGELHNQFLMQAFEDEDYATDENMIVGTIYNAIRPDRWLLAVMQYGEDALERRIAEANRATVTLLSSSIKSAYDDALFATSQANKVSTANWSLIALRLSREELINRFPAEAKAPSTYDLIMSLRAKIKVPFYDIGPNPTRPNSWNKYLGKLIERMVAERREAELEEFMTHLPPDFLKELPGYEYSEADPNLDEFRLFPYDLQDDSDFVGKYDYYEPGGGGNSPLMDSEVISTSDLFFDNDSFTDSAVHW